MKVLLPSYIFDAIDGEITILDSPPIRIEQLLIITNVTRNQIIYNFANPKLGGTILNNNIALDVDTSGMDGSDKLQIFIEDYSVPSTETTLTAVNFNLVNSNTLLNSLTSQQLSSNNYLIEISSFTNEIEPLIRTVNSSVSSRLLTINQNTSATNNRLQTLIDHTDLVENLINDVKTVCTSISGSVDNVELHVDGIENLVIATNTLIRVLTGQTNRINGFVIPDYNAIRNTYYGSSNNLSQVDYLSGNTIVASLSFNYATSNTSNGALVYEVRKIL